MIKRLMAVVLAVLMMSGVALAKQIEVYMRNDTDVKKTVSLKWINHPHGCSVCPITGRLLCEFAVMVAETKPGRTHTKILKDSPNTEWGNVVGRKYCTVWSNTHYNIDGEKETMQCFEVEEGTQYIYITPDSIEITMEKTDEAN
jgi:hypothetical protein